MGRPRAGYWGQFLVEDPKPVSSPMTQHIDLTGRGRKYRQVLNDEDDRVVLRALHYLLATSLVFTTGLWLSTLV